MAVAVFRNDRGTSSETARGEHVMSNIIAVDPLMSHQICHILKNLQSPAFEKQIKEIDEAITGGGSNFGEAIKCRKCVNFFC